MQLSDFKEDAPGKLVPAQGGMGFVPDPLPPTGGWFDNETVTLLARADNAIGRLQGTVRGLLNPYLVASPLLQREAILSSRIEGTFTTPEDLVASQGQGDPSVDSETLEVRNYVNVGKRGRRTTYLAPEILAFMRD